jgi:hypothetical protein
MTIIYDFSLSQSELAYCRNNDGLNKSFSSLEEAKECANRIDNIPYRDELKFYKITIEEVDPNV